MFTFATSVENNIDVSQQKRCNLRQTQNGLMKLSTSKLVKLSLARNAFGLETNRAARVASGVFKGYVEITNNGEQFVAYKIMSRPKAKLVVKPAYGFIERGETVVLQVTAASALSTNRVLNKHLSIVIFATTCEVVNTVVPTDLPSFWKSIIYDGSHAFVEVLEINKFHIFNMNSLTAQSDVNIGETNQDSDDSLVSSTGDNNNNYANDDSHADLPLELESQTLSVPSSNYLLQQPNSESEGQVSEASGNCSSHSSIRLKPQQKLTTESIVRMKKLSKSLKKRDKSTNTILACLIIFIAAAYYLFMQKNLARVVASIEQLSE